MLEEHVCLLCKVLAELKTTLPILDPGELGGSMRLLPLSMRVLENGVNTQQRVLMLGRAVWQFWWLLCSSVVECVCSAMSLQ